MNERKDKLEALFHAAAELNSPEQREIYLKHACGGDDALRSELETLLRAVRRADQFFDDPALAGPPSSASTTVAHTAELGPCARPTEGPGTVIGRYKLLQKIGEGGCGVVYMAEQSEPVKRRVALKVIKLGMDTQSVIARFEAERQALAIMDHPCIAKVLDAGATETGRPYFVMELVRGVKITDYCDQTKLSTRERLELFIKVCQAIQHAHQKGIIHRDIKPSNILVTVNDGVPVPKVIDFGIAKATTGQQLTDKTLFTAFEQFIGTPAYMSPEQAVMTSLDIDTRSDIYALGVLLYELLTGTTPFDPRELLASGLDELRRTIRDKEPARPSTRVSSLPEGEQSTTASRRGLEAPTLVHLLRGDLDWIVMKCLEKDRARRYDTANGLAMEIERHLNNEPVMARPPSAAYRFQKMVRRNKGAALATAAIAVTLLLALAFISTALVRERRARRAATEAEQAQARLRASADQAREQAEQARADEAAARKNTDEALARETKLHREGSARVYATDVFLAQQALLKTNYGRARELLERHYPNPGQTNKPGWEWRYLWQQARGDYQFNIPSKNGLIMDSSTSPDGKWLAVARAMAGVSVIDISHRQSPREVRTFPSEFFCAAEFAPHEDLLAYSATSMARSSVNSGSPSSRYSSTLRVQNLRTQKSITLMTNLPGACASLRFSSDARTLFSYRMDPAIGLGAVDQWRVSDGALLASRTNLLAGHDFSRQLAVASNQTAVAHAGKSLTVLDLSSLAVRWTNQASGGDYQCAAFSPDGRILFSAEGSRQSAHSIIRVWDSSSGREIAPPLEGHRDDISSLVVTRDGKSLISSSKDQSIRVWDVSDPAKAKALGRPLQGHRSAASTLALLPDDKSLVSGSVDGELLLWDLGSVRDSFRPIRVPSENNLHYAWSSDGRFLRLVSRDGEVIQWRDDEPQAREPLFHLGQTPQSAYFCKDGSLLGVGTTQGALELWDVNRRQLVRKFGQYSQPVIQLYFSSDNGRLLVWDTQNRQIDEWNLSTFQKVGNFPDESGAGTRGLTFSADFRWILSPTYDGAFTLLETKTGRRLNRQLDIQNVFHAAFSQDARFFAAASFQGNVGVWETETMRPVAVFGDRESPIYSMRFSPDGSKLLTGTAANAVTLWDVATLLPLIKLESTEAVIWSVGFAPDGNQVFSRSRRQPRSGQLTMEVWRAPSWEEIERDEASRRAAKPGQPRVSEL